ncbi:MAG: hypothetical protein IH840_13745 [Candidatus Heimdallarchaeota archaeon]|nr:hypothetical protein [Candidatus Heimdallarchaeota archaeon]
MLEKNPRTVEPFGGKIDYDIDGRLIGNWYLQGFDFTRYDENYKLLMLPANCQLCGYQFSNKKIKAPSKCPDCRREKITLPQFKIQEK